MKPINKVIIIVFFIIGVSFVTLNVHEYIHVIQLDTPTHYCYDFGDKTVAHVSGYDDNWNDMEMEIIPYIISFIAPMIGGMYVYKVLK